MIKTKTDHNKIGRIMFSLGVKGDRFKKLSHNIQQKCLLMKRKIHKLIETKNYQQAKWAAKTLVGYKHNQKSMWVIAKKIKTVLAIVRKKLPNSDTLDPILQELLTRAHIAVCGDDLVEMHVKLTTLKRYLEFFEKVENDVYKEVYDELYLCPSLAPKREPIICISEYMKPAMKNIGISTN